MHVAYTHSGGILALDFQQYKEDGEIKCETPQIEEPPAEPIDNLFREQKMREFSL